MIEWLTTNINTPEPGREIIAKNPLKPAGYSSSSKQCKIMKFNPTFKEDLIAEIMDQEGYTLWSYTE